MNERFETIIKQFIVKEKDFRLSYLTIITMFIIGGFAYVYASNNMISYLFIGFGFACFLLIPVKKQTIKKFNWILENYQKDKDACLLILNAYKNNLKGITIASYFYNEHKIALYKEAIKLLNEL